uniref:Helicase-associated domain-containing protein n=1 Tax=Amphora coffeiformis TaxID=265554 RepID=A0A7S3KX38_9STRA|mmetsp:Transcript_7877/g.15011  ORF Transcript_7877/g.15011 Transcript_7877/m.15011 type:complete len:445 (-) Transcript_7877:64-1398(-)
MTSTHHDDDEEIEESDYAKSVEFVTESHSMGNGDDDDNHHGYDGGEGDNDDDGGGEGGQDEQDPPSRVDSERTNSTTTTMFSASSLPSLEGIDLVSATRPSFSSLPPNDDDDGEDTMEPSTVVTEDRNYANNESPPPFRTTAKPLPASPRLPTATYGNQVVRQSKAASFLSTPFRKKRAVEAVATPSTCSASVNSSTTTWTTGETLRKRARRVGQGTEHNHHQPMTTTTIPKGPSEDVTDTVSLESSHHPAQDTVASCAPTSSIPLNLQHHSKHDEKWFAMFEQLKEYQRAHGDTLVPQTFAPNRRLGRWVHYQRVEYWVFQQKGKAKINAERIRLLESIGFEWDPQKVQWQAMYEKLCQFVRQHGHAKVPKGYSDDAELANWVRNQRLEHRNWEQEKRSGMTPERFGLLDKLGFVWSTTSAKKKTQKSSDSNDESKSCQAVRM